MKQTTRELIQQIAESVLEDFGNEQINLQSEAARIDISNAIAERWNEECQQLKYIDASDTCYGKVQQSKAGWGQN